MRLTAVNVSSDSQCSFALSNGSLTFTFSITHLTSKFFYFNSYCCYFVLILFVGRFVRIKQRDGVALFAPVLLVACSRTAGKLSWHSFV